MPWSFEFARFKLQIYNKCILFVYLNTKTEMSQALKLMVHITKMSYKVRNFHQPYTPWLEKRSHSSRTVLGLTTDKAHTPTTHAPAFVAPWLCPPNSPDFNPVDYEVCSVLQIWSTVLGSTFNGVNHLNQRLVKEWHCFDHIIIEQTIQLCHVWLHVHVHENGGHFWA